MTVVLDDGLNRRLTFRGGKLGNWFDIVTWDGVLVFNGDMGSYMFARIPDMFQFFQTDDTFRINPDYWASKMIAVDASSSYKVLSETKARAEVAHIARNIRKHGRNADVHELLESVDYYSNRDGFFNSIADWTWEFPDVYYSDLEEHSYGFLWCLHAIVWGIEKYNASKANAGV